MMIEMNSGNIPYTGSLLVIARSENSIADPNWLIQYVIFFNAKMLQDFLNEL